MLKSLYTANRTVVRILMTLAVAASVVFGLPMAQAALGNKSPIIQPLSAPIGLDVYLYPSHSACVNWYSGHNGNTISVDVCGGNYKYLAAGTSQGVATYTNDTYVNAYVTQCLAWRCSGHNYYSSVPTSAVNVGPAVLGAKIVTTVQGCAISLKFNANGVPMQHLYQNFSRNPYYDGPNFTLDGDPGITNSMSVTGSVCGFSVPSTADGSAARNPGARVVSYLHLHKPAA